VRGNRRIVFAFSATLATLGFAAAFSTMSTRAQEGGLVLTSPAFRDGESIPSEYTCDGADLVPPLAWSGVPAQARSLALIVDDPDVPDPAAPKRTWVHWVVYDIPPTASGIAEGGGGAKLPAGSKEGINDWRRPAFGGPCPPIGRHRYFHKLYALDVELKDRKTPTKPELEAAMQGHVLASAVLVGTYERSRTRGR
jgi:Raf kinase inhibitor-like YbhB/YbcL family protein